MARAEESTFVPVLCLTFYVAGKLACRTDAVLCVIPIIERAIDSEMSVEKFLSFSCKNTLTYIQHMH